VGAVEEGDFLDGEMIGASAHDNVMPVVVENKRVGGERDQGL